MAVYTAMVLAQLPPVTLTGIFIIAKILRELMYGGNQMSAWRKIRCLFKIAVYQSR